MFTRMSHKQSAGEAMNYKQPMEKPTGAENPEDRNELGDFVSQLYKLGLFKFGSFILKSGYESPIYVDLRGLVSHPKLMEQVASVLAKKARTLMTPDTIICGIPYTALPLATLISVQLTSAMVIVRQEGRKQYGTKKQVEGCWQTGQNCLLIDDVCSSGGSLLDVADILRKSTASSDDKTDGNNEIGGPLEVTDALVLVDRQTGGREVLEAQGRIQLHSVLTLTDICDILKQRNFISEEMVGKVHAFIEKTHADTMEKSQGNKPAKSSLPALVVSNAENLSVDARNYMRMPYSKRRECARHQTAARLFNIMQAKQTNLCVAADLADKDAILALANHVGPHICALKVHCDIIRNFSETFVAELKYFAEKHNFLLMEDRKFVDIGAAVAAQLEGGLFRIGSWADLVTVSLLPGPGILDAIKQARSNRNLGVVLLAEMSSAGNLCQHATLAAQWACMEPDLVCGFISQSGICDAEDAGLVRMTPGVRADDKTGDGLDQQYNSPDYVVSSLGADVIIVGRGITDAKEELGNKSLAEAQTHVAERYQKLGWEAYEKRLTRMHE